MSPTSPRRALDARALAAALQQRGSAHIALEVRAMVTSTNDVVARPVGRWSLLAADEQTAGRGRAGRQWASPRGAGIAMSLWAPLSDVRCTHSAVPLLVGLGVCDALDEHGVAASLKWPNDVLVGQRKLGGILVQLYGDGVVIGIGLNTDLSLDELPTPVATSLALEGTAVVREELIAAAAHHVAARVGSQAVWVTDYRERSATLGRDVRVEVTGGGEVTGRCLDVRADGALLLDTSEGEHVVTVGDVHHLRPWSDAWR